MKKYKNTKETFVLTNQKQDFWISFNSEATIINQDDNNLEILLKDLGKKKIEKDLFYKYFELVGDANADDIFEFYSDKNKISSAKIISLVNKLYTGRLKEWLTIAIKKAEQDAFNAPGSIGVINIIEFREYNLTKNKNNGLKSIGSPIFNRRKRWAPIAEIDNWDQHGKPAPIGIRDVDYAPLKMCNEIFKDLLVQIFSMEGINNVPTEVEKILEKKIEKNSHICFYCGKKVKIELFDDQKYKSKVHALNFCHRDPSERQGRTKLGNVYIGHTVCNRIQGGLSEKNRIVDGLRLLNLYNYYYQDDEVKAEIKKLIKLR
jgi:hypothetical protein